MDRGFSYGLARVLVTRTVQAKLPTRAHSSFPQLFRNYSKASRIVGSLSASCGSYGNCASRWCGRGRQSNGRFLAGSGRRQCRARYTATPRAVPTPDADGLRKSANRNEKCRVVAKAISCRLGCRPRLPPRKILSGAVKVDRGAPNGREANCHNPRPGPAPCRSGRRQGPAATGSGSR